MVHCGFEPTAVNDAIAHPFKALRVALRGPRTEGPMAPDPPGLDRIGEAAGRAKERVRRVA
jgi:hypothetical protein